MNFSIQKQFFGVFGWFLLCFGASAVGAVASVKAQSFYGQLAQPAWAPPPWLFGPVWTVLYALMAIAAWLVWRNGGFEKNRNALLLFLIQLALNSLWSWLFFAWQLGGLAFLEIICLWALIVATIISFWRIQRVAGTLLVPYVLWVTFASVLNYSLWRLNPQLLG